MSAGSQIHMPWQWTLFNYHGRKEGLYLFPPFAMISKCLMKVRQDKTSVVLLAPPWQTQPWFPNLLSMLVDNPILLPPYKDILLSPNGQVHPLVHQSRFRLAAWRISGNETLTRGFQNKLPSCWQHIPGGKAQPPLTTAVGDSGVAGVMADKWIHFVPLW